MQQSIISKLENLNERHQELGELLSTQEIINDQKQFRKLSKEYSDLEPIISAYQEYTDLTSGMQASDNIINDKTEDAEIRQMALEELTELKSKLPQVEKNLQILLLPKDPDDTKNVFLEVRAGTGGDEAAIFAGDLFRMYAKYAESKRWQVEIVSQNLGEHGGFKEIIAKVIGNDVYANLKFESGAHRVQRVPATESQGRIHTSACTVAIMPQSDEINEIDINPSDLRIDTYRSSGAGGQHVNTTDSAVRITHLPTGIVVECQDERSQHKNKAKAMSLLGAKILQEQKAAQHKAQADTRRDLVGSGDRSERIRTYNFPQGRCTDHRINLTLYKLDEIMEGNLDCIIQPLRQEHQTDLLSGLSES